MDRLNRVYEHPLYRREMEALAVDEINRKFCRHGVEHLMEVARLCYIYCLEDGVNIKREIIYTAAFLHDIGRHKQNRDGEPHDEAGARLARLIMTECGYAEHEIDVITEAISEHRNREHETPLGEYLFKADKKSRMCFACSVRDECNWPDDKMNMRIDR